MKKTILIMISIIIILLIILNIDFPLNSKKMYGKYANMNFDNEICCVEAPHESDTLELFEDGNFQSKFYGKGKFQITNGVNPIIELKYTDFGKSAIYRTYFVNKIFEKTKIMLNADANHYYEKID